MPAPSIDNTLRAIYFSRNAIPLALDLPNSLGTAGVFAARTLLFGSATEAGDTFTIEWAWQGVDYSVEFTVSATPDADAYEVPAGSGAAYAQGIIESLLEHPDIFQFFDVQYTFSTDPDLFGFRLISRIMGDITLTASAVGFSFVLPSSTTGAAPTLPVDYLASAWILIAAAHDTPVHQFTRIGELELKPNKDGMAYLDPSEIIDAFFEIPETPTATTGAPVLCTEVQRQFYMVIGEKYGDPVERRRAVLSNVLNVIKGGIAPHDYASLAGGAPDIASSQFLTLRTTREIAANQKDWLYFYGDTPPGDQPVYLRATIYYTDGTTLTTNLWTSTSIITGKVYQTAAGYVESGVQAAADVLKTVYKYTLDLYTLAPGTDTPVLMRAPVTYYIARPDYLDLHFEYENTFGAVESWCMKGVRAMKGSHTHTPLRRTRYLPEHSQGATGVSFAELLSYNERDELSLQFSTGPMSQSEARAFRDFLRTRHKWLRVGTHRIPLRIDPGEYTLDSQTLTADYIRQHTFTATLPPSLGVSDLIPLFS